MTSIENRNILAFGEIDFNNNIAPNINKKFKKTYNKHEWKYDSMFSTYKSVQNWIKEHNLIKLSTTSCMDAITDNYRCSFVPRSEYIKCPVRGKVIKLHTDSNYIVEYTTWQHDHSKLKSKIPEEYIQEILEQAKSKTKPFQILKSIERRFGKTFPITIRQIRYEIQKHEHSQPIVSFGDLTTWIKSLRSIPNDLDKPFCIGFTQNPAAKKFNAVFTTIRLLSNARHSIWCADTTYKTVWQGYPLNVFGIQDAMQKFHLIALALATNETVSDYAFAFKSIKEAAERVLNVDVKPSYILSDAAFQIKNGFCAAFPYVEGTNFSLMCWFHVKKALKEAKFTLPEFEEHLINDIGILHQCPSHEIFKNVSEQFVKYWIDFDPEFVEYFKNQWLNLHPNWFGGACINATDTNNLTEGFNSSLKRYHTIRSQQPLSKFKETLIETVNYKSEMYIREQEKKVLYTSPKLTTEDWKGGVTFANNTDNKRRVFTSDNNTFYILSGIEAVNQSRSITTFESAVDLYNQGKFTTDFEDYVKNIHQRAYKLILNSNWSMSTCTCPYRLKNPICKHIIGIALVTKKAICPPEANPTLLTKKKSRGRPPKAKSALERQDNIIE